MHKCNSSPTGARFIEVLSAMEGDGNANVIRVDMSAPGIDEFMESLGGEGR